MRHNKNKAIEKVSDTLQGNAVTLLSLPVKEFW